MNLFNKLIFEPEDHQILEIIDNYYNPSENNEFSNNFDGELHPRGIIQLATPQYMRLIIVMLELLNSTDNNSNSVKLRIAALKRIKEELFDGLHVPLKYNTGRVILEIIKELVRLKDDTLKRLRLAHDLRNAFFGNPLFIRKMLKRYHLLEMPEDCTPITFDYHVHDSNTKGRKTPSHLIMDAWIKGIQKIQVIYYNTVPTDAAVELLSAAQTMNIEVRIGVEFRSLWYGKFVELIWTPRGFMGANDYLNFLKRKSCSDFYQLCIEANKVTNASIYRASSSDIKKNIDSYPKINLLNPNELIDQLRKISSGFRLTLNLTMMPLEQVIVLLFECSGDITSLELFNFKDEIDNCNPDREMLNKLRHALNSGNVLQLKGLIHLGIMRLKKRNDEFSSQLLQRHYDILKNMPQFISYYSHSTLDVSIGSDSTSISGKNRHGMGFAVIDTLPIRVQKLLKKKNSTFERLKITSQVYLIKKYSFLEKNSFGNKIFSPKPKVAFDKVDLADKLARKVGNVVSLGAPFNSSPKSEILKKPVSGIIDAWDYIDTRIRSIIKVLIGLTTAFITFRYLSNPNQWYFLSYFGAFIWLGITLVRNIIQAVASGGNFRSSSLKWNDFVSWHRIADSLFWTGLSVPLLDYVVKNLILFKLFDITPQNNPALVYTALGVANGLYITTHNIIRAFPIAAIRGNWLRVPLAIPISLCLNFIIGTILRLIGINGIESILQQWSAVLYKLSSDIVAGVVEASADRAKYIKASMDDIDCKLKEFYALTATMELLSPEEVNTPSLFDLKKSDVKKSGLKKSTLLKSFYINALDIMHIWLRQPQAKNVVKKRIALMTPDERKYFVECQHILEKKKSITKLFLSNLVGENFSKALAFYLRYNSTYLKELDNFNSKVKVALKTKKKK